MPKWIFKKISGDQQGVSKTGKQGKCLLREILQNPINYVLFLLPGNMQTSLVGSKGFLKKY